MPLPTHISEATRRLNPQLFGISPELGAKTKLVAGIVMPDSPAKKRLRQNTPAQLPAFFSTVGIPEATPEFRFAPPRRWRFDFAWPDFKIALEIEGGVWTGGRHTRGKGFLADVQKYNEAVCLGWRVVRVTPDEMSTIKPADLILRLMKNSP